MSVPAYCPACYGRNRWCRRCKTTHCGCVYSRPNGRVCPLFLEVQAQADGKKDIEAVRRAAKMTTTMWRVLCYVADGLGSGHNCHGMSEHGGRCSVTLGLIQRGLINPHDHELTPLGKWIVETSRRPAPESTP